jgi:glutathione peroxidase-family protein
LARLVLLSTPFLDTGGGVEGDWEIKIVNRLPANQHHTSFNHPQPEISSHNKTQYQSDFMSGAFVKHDSQGFRSTRIYPSLKKKTLDKDL